MALFAAALPALIGAAGTIGAAALSSGGGGGDGGVQNVTPPRQFDLPLEEALTGTGSRMLQQAAPFSPFGAGYNLLPDQALGQIYMPGPNATLFGNNPFGLTPHGQGFFGGAYNQLPQQNLYGSYGGYGGGYGGYGPPQGTNPFGGFGGYPQPQPYFQGPSFGQAGFPYSAFAQFQQGYGNPYGYGYTQNVFPGYGGGGHFIPPQGFGYGNAPSFNTGGQANLGFGGDPGSAVGFYPPPQQGGQSQGQPQGQPQAPPQQSQPQPQQPAPQPQHIVFVPGVTDQYFFGPNAGDPSVVPPGYQVGTRVDPRKGNQ